MARPRKNAARAQNSLLTPDEVVEIPVEEQPYPLPEGWKWAYWGSCGDFIAGNAFKPDFQGKKGLLYPFYKVGSLKFSDNKGYLYDIEHSISEETQKSIKSSIIPEHSIIFAKIGEAIRLNRRSINEKKCCIDNNLMAFVPQKTTYKYVYYWSLGIDLYKYTNATTVPAIRKTDLEKIVFPLPPLDEQQRIVDRIESFFAKLDDAKAKAEAVLDGFEIRKAAILHKAFTGELTKKWRTEQRIGMESWNVKRLIEISHFIKAGGDKPDDFQDDSDEKHSIPVVANGIDHDGIIGYTSWTKNYKDALTVAGRGTIGFPCWRNYNFFPVVRLIVIHPNTSIIIGKFLYYLFLAFPEKGTGSTIPQLTVPMVKTKEVPLCTLPEQQEIVRILDNLLAKEQQAKEVAENVLSQIDLMKKAILARAFRGELGTHGSARNSSQNN